MTMHTRSNIELLSILVGKTKTKKLYRNTLLPLLFAKEGSCNYIQEFAAARELMKRSLKEELQYRDAFTAPDIVADYLKTMLTGYEHEVFVTYS